MESNAMHQQPQTSKILQSESHLHLYGCLDAKSVWSVSQDRAAKFADRFQWFLGEYERATGVTINPKRWWDDNDAFETFKEQFICGHAVSFDVFQAKFNLLIALFPPTPSDMWLANETFKTHAKSSGFKEYRTFLPLYLPKPDRAAYLKRVIETAASHESADYHPRIAISFMRKNTEAWENYRFLCEFLENHPDLAPWITGIDFCASERGHPPSAKKQLFEQIHADNQKRKFPIEILYHVGEMWQDISIASAARWCAEAAQLGAHRLGHALALGMNCDVLRGRKICESAHETEQHFAWLRANGSALHEFGFTPIDYEWLRDQAESSKQEHYVEWVYNDDLIENTRRFQDAALTVVREIGPIVESCPTSNMRIGSLHSPSQHPLRRFLDHRLKVTISTDDPGIFDVSLADEEINVLSHFAVSADELATMESRTRRIFETRS